MNKVDLLIPYTKDDLVGKNISMIMPKIIGDMHNNFI